MILRTAHRRQTWPTNKRHYSEFQRTDYTSVTAAFGQRLDSQANFGTSTMLDLADNHIRQCRTFEDRKMMGVPNLSKS
jgi:hypothetical protein